MSSMKIANNNNNIHWGKQISTHVSHLALPVDGGAGYLVETNIAADKIL